MADNEKTYTLKSVQAELAKLEKAKEKKRAKIQELTASLKADNAKIKELETIYDRLYREDVQRQISNAWFKEQHMTKAQIQKFLELSAQIHDKIDILDVATLVQAITHVYHAKQEELQQEELRPDQIVNYDDEQDALQRSPETSNPDSLTQIVDEGGETDG